MFTATCESIYARLGLPDSRVIVDVRRTAEIDQQPRMIPGSVRTDPDNLDSWIASVPQTRSVVVYGQRGMQEPGKLAETLRTRGFHVVTLEGGLDRWIERRYPTIRVRVDLNAPGNSRWVTRERPKIDRLACPWLVRRFIDPNALFFYVPAHQVRSDAQALGAEPYDIADVTFSHRGERCSFDAFLDEFELQDPYVGMLAEIVRAADTGRAAESKEAPGLLAISLGLSANISDDIILLEQAMPLYDALYAWCKTAHDESHSWPQQAQNKNAR